MIEMIDDIAAWVNPSVVGLSKTSGNRLKRSTLTERHERLFAAPLVSDPYFGLFQFA